MPDSEMPSPPIAIIGAGISGLVLGQCLRRKNIAAVIYERVKENPTRNNYGITLYKTTYRPLLETLKLIEHDFESKVAVQKPNGGGVVADQEKLRVNRAALTRLLQDGLDVRWEHKLSSVTSSDSSTGTRSFAVQHADQARKLDYGLMIGVDGVHSATRSSLLQSEFHLQVLNYIVFNGKRRMRISNIPSGLLDCFEKPDGIVHKHDRAVLSLKADFWQPDKQTVAVSYTLSRPATDSDKSLLERNISDAETLADQFVQEVAALGELPDPFGGVFNPATMREDRLLHWLMRAATLGPKQSQRLARDHHVVLLGDAAHPQPIPGYGANVAIQDAMTLANHINAQGKIGDWSFLNDLINDWAKANREAEQDLEDLHPAGASKARI